MTGRRGAGAVSRRPLLLEPLEERRLLSAMPELIANINQAPQSSSPREFVEVGGTMFFVATTRNFGRELWKTDGTAAGTAMVKDIFPGEGGASPESLTKVGNTLYFMANDGAHGGELWKSDGTESGTVLVKDIWPGASWSVPSSLAEMNGNLFFTAKDGTQGLKIWKSDGSASGTMLVKNIWELPDTTYEWSELDRLTTVNGTSLFFVTSRWQLVGTSIAIQHDCNLWKSDGTEMGTVLVKDVNPDNTNYPPLNENIGSFVDYGGVLFFLADDGVQGTQLWKTDGTASGTVLVRDVFPGDVSSNPYLLSAGTSMYFVADDGSGDWGLWKADLTQSDAVLLHGGFQGPFSLENVGGTLFFAAEEASGTQGLELWKSDGTESGTVLVKDIWPGTHGSSPSQETEVRGTVYFSANDGTHGTELWKSDGTATGTSLFADIRSGSDSSSPANLTNVNGVLYFTADDGVHGRGLWKTDGTPVGTALLANVVPGWFMPFNGQAIFLATDSALGEELWKTDGTAAGTVVVRDVFPGDAGSNPSPFTGSTSVYLVADDGIHGKELWNTDGTNNGTQLIKNVVPDHDLVEVSGTSYFATGKALWKSDGTSSGTVKVKSISDNRFGASGPDELTNLNGTLLFVANPGWVLGTRTTYEMLWRSDGTEGGTMAFSVPYWDGHPRELTVAGNAVYFQGMDSAHGQELWKTDGTVEGTVLVKDILSGTNSSLPTSLTDVDGTLYFTASGGILDAFRVRLWKSDGTATGTSPIAGIPSGSGSSSPTNLTNVNGVLYLTADDGVHGQELWKTDGTPAGTVLVSDIHAGSYPSSPSELLDANGTLYFVADDGVHGRELWKTDGTPAGTVLVSDIHAGSYASSPSELLYANGTLYFVADDGIHGRELWMSDGTAAGTVLVMDILPGPTSASPRNLVNANRAIYFIADDGLSGAEPWVLPFGPVVIDVVDVAPDARNTAVSTVDVVFSTPIDLSTFTFQDLTLTRNGSQVSLTSEVTIGLVSETTYRVSGLSTFTTLGGTYVVTVTGAGVQDVVGNAGIGSASDPWVMYNTPQAVIYSANMDTDPGWTFDAFSKWAWGRPTGEPTGSGGWPDPTSGHTGAKVVGYNLFGPYPNNMSRTLYVTTPAINCFGYTDVTLDFWRWLGVDTSAWDHAYVQVSNNGISWTTVW